MIFGTALMLLLVKYSISGQASYYSSSEENKSPWPTKNSSNFVKIPYTVYQPKFTLDEVKNRKLKWLNVLSDKKVDSVKAAKGNNNKVDYYDFYIPTDKLPVATNTLSDNLLPMDQTIPGLYDPKKGIVLFVNTSTETTVHQIPTQADFPCPNCIPPVNNCPNCVPQPPTNPCINCVPPPVIPPAIPPGIPPGIPPTFTPPYNPCIYCVGNPNPCPACPTCPNCPTNSNPCQDCGSCPNCISREEHEREIRLLEQKYKLQCTQNPGFQNKVNKINLSPVVNVKIKKNQNKHPQESSEESFVDKIGDVLDNIYETVADAVTHKVVSVDNDKAYDGKKVDKNTTSLNPPLPQLENSKKPMLPPLNVSRPTKHPVRRIKKTKKPKPGEGKPISKRSAPSSEISKQYHTFQGNKGGFEENVNKSFITTHIRITNELSTPKPNIFPTTSTPRTTPLPCKKVKQETDNDDDYYDIDELWYDDYDNSEEDHQEPSSSKEQEAKTIRTKDKIRRKTTKDYDYLGVFDYIYKVVKPIRRVIRKMVIGTTKIASSAAATIIAHRKPKYPQSSVYSTSNDIVSDDQEPTVQSYLGSLFSSWFGSGENDQGDVQVPTTTESGWFDSWFDSEGKATTPKDDEDDGNSGWFNWFSDSNPIRKRHSTIASTTSAPILTIVDPMKNPQNWIGLLAQHIVNSTTKKENQFENKNYIPEKITYEKYQIWRLKPSGEEHFRILENYKNSQEGAKLQWLQGPSLRGLTDVLVPPKHLYDFQGTLNFEDIPYEVLVFDLGKAILYETRDIKFNNITNSKAFTMNWSHYYSYDDILRFVDWARLKNPDLVEVIHIGRSYEGRPLVIVKISQEKSTTSPKRKNKFRKKSQSMGVFIEAGGHGREWIGPAAANWIIYEILKIFKSNATTALEASIQKATWYIMPVLNPDGYEYTREYDRMWRKSRSKQKEGSEGFFNAALTWLKTTENVNKTCFGVDLNRNWDYHSSSNSPCNEFYAGDAALSEPETRALSTFLINQRKQLKLFVSLQSYGQVVSYSNYFNSSYSSQKLDDLTDVALVGVDGLRKSGSRTRYRVDANNDLIPDKTGTSDHFATNEVGIPFSYAVHIGDNGVHGYLLPGTYIEPTARDTFEIIKAMVDYIS